MEDAVRRRERDFHDAVAAPLEAAAMPPQAPDRLCAELLNRAGDLSGKRVLELGCGKGDLSLLLALRGARLTALDLSPKMVSLAKARVEHFVGQADFVVAPIESTGLPDAGFDVVVGSFILHHSLLEGAVPEIRRVLDPSGRAVFVENSGLNPALRLARRYLPGRFGIPRYSTDDEHPLARGDYALFRKHFRSVEIVAPDLQFFWLLDRQVLRYRYRPASWILRKLDALLWLVPALRKYAYHIVLDLRP